MAEKIAPITSLQPPYNLINRSYEPEILPYCKEQNIGTIIYSPMVSGLLTGKMTRERIAALPEDDWRRKTPNFNEPKLTKNLELVEKLKEVGAKYNATPGEIAIAWTLRNLAVTAAIVGARSKEQSEVVMHDPITLTDEEAFALESVLK
jgi:aryl-alcohol dehydrogenase-like predicted oxidoreductase